MKQRSVLFLLLVLTSLLHAQQSNVMYYMYRVPQASFLNPARQYPCRFYMSLPLLSSIHFNYSNTAFSVKAVSDIIDNTMIINTDKILKHIHHLDHISTELHYTLFSMGFKQYDYYFSFSMTEKNEMYLSLPGDLSKFIINGNVDFLEKNKPAKFNRIGINLMHYREYAFGASRELSEGVLAGIRAKVLFGKANINTRAKQLTIYTDPDTYDITVHSDAKINVSGPVLLETNPDEYIDNISYDHSASLSKIIFNRRNPGLALDGGFFYQYDDNLTLSGSFNDLGFIWWHSYLNNASQNGTFTFNGQTESNATGDNLVMHLVDSIRTLFAPAFTHRGYVTALPLKVYGGAEYKINSYLRAGVLGRLWMYQYRMHPSLTVHGSILLSRFATLTATWSYNNYTLRNLGAGITLQTSNIQLYALTDNYAAFFWWKSARNVNARLGLNLFFGCRTKGRSTGRHGGSNLKCAGCYWYQSMEEKRKRRD